ncbi:uncharacterized protein BCN122_II2733 [Burkholderia cenocepacia]|nr:uncharacterized protein BCN122_II2733 [Burkholderia cenocepacia]
MPKRYFGGAAAVDGRRPGIGAETLRIADTIRTNAVRHPGDAMSASGDRC